MQKVPSLFERDWAGDKNRVLPIVVAECAWVMKHKCLATRKYDGTAAMVRGGLLFKRYDAKHGKTPPPGFEPCQEPDTVTGHWPGWVPVRPDNPADRWFYAAPLPDEDGTYELIGPKIGGNPEGFAEHTFKRHGGVVLEVPDRSFDGLTAFLTEHIMEGIVFHHDDGRMAKVKARDLGLRWPRNIEPELPRVNVGRSELTPFGGVLIPPAPAPVEVTMRRRHPYAYGPTDLHAPQMLSVLRYSFPYVIGLAEELSQFKADGKAIVAVAKDQETARKIVEALNRP